MLESNEPHVAVIAFVPESRAAMLERMAGEITIKSERSVTESTLVRELVEMAWQLFVSRSIADQRRLRGPEFMGILRMLHEQPESTAQ